MAPVSTAGINIGEVPQSQHSIFIRGFPGDLDMGKIKDFFNKQAGSCAIDFFKQSMDMQFLYVAVRFETRDVAREMMSKYNDQKVFGHPIKMVWFRDVRRYANSGRGPNNYPPPTYRGRGRGYHSNRPMEVHGNPYWKESSRSSLTRTFYPNRRRSRSSSKSRSSSHEGRSKRKSFSRSRSLSTSPARSVDKMNSIVDNNKTTEVKNILKKDKKEERKRKRSTSVKSRSSGELTDNSDHELAEENSTTSKQMKIATPTPTPSLTTEQKKEKPKRHERIVIKVGSSLPKPNPEPTEEPALKEKDEAVLTVTETPEQNNSTRVVTITDDVMNIQKNTLSKFFEKPETPTPEISVKPPINHKKVNSQLKLSDFTKQVTAESDRQKRIKNLSEKKAEMFRMKKEQMEITFKQDCETFSTVTKMLISKDPSLEGKLLNCLRESLRDIGKRFIDDLNEFLDTLLDDSN